jgi:predicted peptidase
MQTAHQSQHLNYLLSVPDVYDGSTAMPLLVFLHGIGERGTDPSIIANYSLPRMLAEGKQIPFIVVSPQCPVETRWDPHTAKVIAVMDEVRGQYNIDPQRIYLTGFSMGGQGTFFVAADFPDRFAAFAPVASRVPPYDEGLLERLCAASHRPFWLFHGEADDQIPVSEVYRYEAALKQCGGLVPRLTTIANLGHSTQPVYDNDELYAWFLAHQL